MTDRFNNPLSSRWEDIFYHSPAVHGTPPVCLLTDENDVPYPDGEINFGYVAPGASEDRVVKVKNVGGSYLNLFDVFLGADPRFTILVEADKTLLGAGESTLVTVRAAVEESED
jgi:hypothetical protein